MVWDIPVSVTLTSRIASWRGNGNSDPASAQYSPKVFTLSAGTHQLIIRGREANTTWGAISIAPAPPLLQIHTAPGRVVTLSGTGLGSQTYNVQASPDFITWTVIGTVKADANGAFTYADPVGANRPRRMYRLQSVIVTAPVLQIHTAPGGPIILNGTGQGGNTYKVQASPDFISWAVIGSVTADASGAFTYADPVGASLPRRLYRLQGP